MKDLFPYHGEKILVTQEMCDYNGHMNTGSYTRCFDGCWGQMYTHHFGMIRIVELLLDF